MPAEIAARAPESEAPALHERNHIGFLPGADLQNRRLPPGASRRGSVAREEPIRIEPVATAVERAAADHNRGRWGTDRQCRPPEYRAGWTGSGRSALDAAASNRPAGTAARSATPLTAALMRAVAQASSDRSIPSPVALRHSLRTAISRQPVPVPRSRIDKGSCRRSRQHLQRRLDEGFAVGPRLQRRGRELERQAPELALAEDAPDRLARETALGKPCEPRCGRLAQPVGGVGGCFVRSRLDEQPRVERSALPASLTQARGKPTPRLRERRRGVLSIVLPGACRGGHGA